jgi:hypothetical protein
LIRQTLAANDFGSSGQIILRSFASRISSTRAPQLSPSTVEALFDENQEFFEKIGQMVDALGCGLLATISTLFEIPSADGESMLARLVALLAETVVLAVDVLCCDGMRYLLLSYPFVDTFLKMMMFP